jgi:crotonobetainyl-CoA:carnitine CoA-transferase CaiB-like acyl-CoA transferase
MESNASTYQPLQGIRVLAFEIAFSLPAGTRTLAELGADVVRVSPPTRGFGSYISIVDGVFLGKKSISIDLRKDEGKEVAARLARAADVVCSNFTPRVMKQFGLGPDDLLALKPTLIVLQLSGYGTPGPWEDFPAYGPSVEAAGGMNFMMGRPTDPPVRVGSGVFADQLSGRYAALALTAALELRQRTGRGQYIDLSMYESIVHLLGHNVLGAGVRARLPRRLGNRDPIFAPQGIYPCAGEDEWIAVTVKSDEAWARLASLIGSKRLLEEELASVENRRIHHDEIDRLIGEWTSGRGKLEAAETLQGRGIAAAPVQKPPDLLLDRHLARRGAFQTIEHARPVLGYRAHPHNSSQWTVMGQGRAKLTDIRLGGPDNAAVLQEWAGMDALEVKRLEEEGTLLPAHHSPVQDRPPPAGSGSPDFAQRLGLPPADEEAAAA